MKKIFCGMCIAGLLLTSACGNQEVSSNETETQTGEYVESTELSESVQENETEETVTPTESKEEVKETETETETEVVEETEVDNQVLKLTQSYKGLDHNNPIMTQKFGADPYAMVYGDRVYFYMTGDTFEYDAQGNIIENSYGKIQEINVVSTDDMVNFTDHGSIKVAGKDGAAKWANNSWAPAAAWKNIDGEDKFFLYFADGGGGIGVLVGDSPTGPFTDPLGKGLIRRDMPNCGNVLWLFDPAVLVDDDGKAYIYFGGGVPADKVADPGTGRVAQLGDDMISIVGEPVRLEAPYLFEDSGIHKYNDKYYYTYCSNWQVDEAGKEKYGFTNAEIVCMESDSPMGPFVYKETIMQNPGRTFGLYGNNHHCVFNFQGNWYITYHARVMEKNMGVEKGYRSTHIDEFTMQEDGTIGRIKQTLKGRTQLKYVDPYAQNRAVNMVTMGGITCVPADEESAKTGNGNMAVGDIQTGDFVKVQGVDFGENQPAKVKIFAKNNSGTEGKVQVRLDGADGELLAIVPIASCDTAEFVEYEAQVEGVAGGVHNLFLIFEGEGYEVEAWMFEK